MNLFKDHLTLFDLEQQPACQCRVALKELRQGTRRPATAALAAYLHIMYSHVLRNARVVHQRTKAKWPAIRMHLHSPLEPAIQLSTIDASSLLDGLD
ncbi:hypothetical protein D9M68_571840 [compost metagenome]